MSARVDILGVIVAAVTASIPSISVYRMRRQAIGYADCPCVNIRYDREQLTSENMKDIRQLSIAIDVYAVGDDAESVIDGVESAIVPSLRPSNLGKSMKIGFSESRWEAEHTDDGLALRQTLVVNVSYRTDRFKTI